MGLVVVEWAERGADVFPIAPPCIPPPHPSPCTPPWPHPCQVAEYKHEIERLQREMNEVKKKYFEQKREQRLAAAGSQGAGGAGPVAAAATGLPVKVAPLATAENGGVDLIPASRSVQGSPVAAGAASLKASPAAALSGVSVSVTAL